MEYLLVENSCRIRAQMAGLFISRGKGIHPTRRIDTYELIFVKQGTVSLWEENHNFKLGTGETLLLHPGRWHGGKENYAPDTMFYWAHFEAIGHQYASDTSDSTISVPQVARIHRPEKLEELYRYFLDEQESGFLDPNSAGLLIMLMLIEVSRQQSAQSDESLASALAVRANTYIRLHFDTPITAGTVARALGYNPDYLGRIYKQMYGYTITEAINRCRIQVACNFLLQSDMSIDSVATSCGFQEPDYFRRLFRRQMQTTPTAYRRQYTRVHVNTL
jgi:AraC-like DNA-binding protein